MGLFAGVFTWLALRRHEAFWTGRFDLGNMVQAVWATAHGDPLQVTNTAGVQFIRLGAHVDPILVAFAPLWRIWPDPRMLLVAQVLVVAAGALPVFWLARRWLSDDRLAVAFAAVYLLYPPVQWLVVTEFHPVALATPLLLFCIWAVEEHRPCWLAVCAPLAALTKEQVGLSLAVLGVWALVRHRRRWTAALLAGGGLAWTAFCVAVVIPHYSPTGGSPFINRYADLGESQSEVVSTLLTRPWDAVATAVSWGRFTYLLALLVPLLLLPFLAPLLALGALPDLGLNLLAQYWPQYSVQYQYTATVIPFLIAASILGLARLRARRSGGPLVRAAGATGPLAALLVAAAAVAGWSQGPLPFWRHVPGGSADRAQEYTVTRHARVQARAVALVPADPEVVVSASNLMGSRLSARRVIYTWPVVKDAGWVLVDERRPFLADRLSTGEHRRLVASLRADRRFRLVFAEDGVLVFHRVGPAR
jgi:uncharacterized membrane protein